MTAAQAKDIILKAIEGKMTAKEFNNHATAVPSIVSLITRLRKLSTNPNAKQVARQMDMVFGGKDYNEDFHNAVSEFYQL